MPTHVTPEDEEPQEAVMRRLGRSLLRLQRRGLVNPPGVRLDGSVFKVLMALTADGPLTVGGLGARLQLDASTTSRHVKAAVTLGVVERALAEDGSHVVRPTPAGLEAFAADSGVRAARFRAVVDGLGAERAERLAADLEALNDALDED
ncbi:MarR family winged helix-turn-helix transcriptional regulator [Nocardioides sp. GY 10127]|uniref:MarR family winged helix-turn-helix transcriptional regulator n=1 Tax=Nocardioides sp. GY 10127 TaxID=2569762 RepID=UPI0010A8951C|nr:MarR family winged helix-turn-helix transcriptional regulator [Nocardioides sp. GY 10127]TIC82640.1 winged helix-turn-helix transcriptional regulator [Nocardioides sp. GY 10127]